VAPVGDRVFVRVADVEDVSSGGILLPSSAQKKPTAGEVIAAGSGCTSVTVGSSVVYSKYAGTEVEMGDDEFVLLKEDDCIGLMSAGGDIKSLKPLGDRILVQINAAATKSTGGVLLAGDSSEKPTIGSVVSVGPGRKAGEGEDAKPSPINISAGNSVLYSQYSGVEFMDEVGTEYIVIRESDVLAVLS